MKFACVLRIAVELTRIGWWRPTVAVDRFLWKVKDKEKPQVKVYKWTGKNDYVALCEPGFISFGGGYVSFSFFLHSHFLFHVQL